MVSLASNFSSSSRYLRGENGDPAIQDLEQAFRIPFSEAESYFKNLAAAPAPAVAIETATDIREQVKRKVLACNMTVELGCYAVAIAIGAAIVTANNVIPPETVSTLTQLAGIVERMDSMYALGSQWAALDVGQQ